MTSPNLQLYFAEKNDPLTSAFKERTTGHPGGGDATRIPPAKIDSTLKQIIQTTRTGKSAVYIHVPFCETHCLYCGFYRKRYSAEESRSYADSLITELQMWQNEPIQQTAPVHAVYLGGGTPTSLESADLSRILAAIRQNLPLANDCEITVEGRIQNFNSEKIRACIEQGANRFSLGVQTFDTTLRQSMKRLADRESVIGKLAELRDLDQASVVIDLIYGFPGQTKEMWQQDLDTMFELEIDGCDLYQLQVLPQTPLQAAIENGKIQPALDTAARARLYAHGCEQMEMAQYRRLSVNHWGRTTRERNIYNHLMRSPSNCLPFGPGAGGSLGGCMIMTDSNYESWQNTIAQGKKPVTMLFQQGRHNLLEKTITGDFELCRISPYRLSKKFGLDLTKCLQPLFDQWTEAGLLTNDGEWRKLTCAGQFWQTNLSQLTLNYLQQTLFKENR